jgi:hypothetical protein
VQPFVTAVVLFHGAAFYPLDAYSTVLLEFTMRIRILHTLTLLALTAFTALAFADTPTRVGRISLTQGDVSISGEVGDQAERALVNWPVTSDNQITTGRDARTEIRIGSTALRLDEDSALEIMELDDERLRLHLHHGSVSVRIRNPDAVQGFELTTPQGRVRLQEPGRIRVDAERQRDTSIVNVFDGVALVDGGGNSLTVRGGRRAEIGQYDVRTGLAVRDSFDDWAMLRDQQDDRVTSDRYVTREMTGYEDLDRYGIWRDDREYGPLWLPRSVPIGWAPYRDGRWAWVAPWGWTWVDNAPWGYAPFHYGRWVLVNQRWCWAPGRDIGRPVWSPALVGWVGGSGWSLSFSSGGSRRPAPAQGWYPLAPHEHFVPGYRVGHDHLRHINRHARDDHKHKRGERDHHRREGLTVVPHEHFARPVPVVVTNAPRAVVPPLALQTAPVVAPPAPHPGFRERGRGPREDRRGEREDWRNRDQHPRQAVAPVAPAPVMPAAPPIVTPPEQPRREWRGGRDDRRSVFEDQRRGRPLQVAPPPVMQPAPVLAAPQPAPMPIRQPVAEPPQQPRVEHPGRGFRGDMERERRREPDAGPRQGGQHVPPPPAFARPAPMPQQQMAAPAPQRAAPPPPPPPAPPAQAAAPQNSGAAQEARQRRMEERADRAERNERGERR